jgi:hypothetical protein
MSNPDIKNTGMKASSVDSLYIATPIAILFALVTITLFYLKDSIPSFNLVFWLSIPLAAAIITGGANTSLGDQSLTFNTSGSSNTSIGWGSLDQNKTGSNNTALGYNAGT